MAPPLSAFWPLTYLRKTVVCIYSVINQLFHSVTYKTEMQGWYLRIDGLIQRWGYSRREGITWKSVYSRFACTNCPCLWHPAGSTACGATRRTWRSLWTSELPAALVGEGRKELLDVIALACRAWYILVAYDQYFKVIITFHTVVFEYRHMMASSCVDFYIIKYKVLCDLCREKSGIL